MALLESILIKKPHFSNKNLSQKRRFSAMQGPLYAPYVEEILPGDTVHVKVYGSVKTYPLKAPLMGSFRQQVAFFFVPTRLYTQEMDVNRLEFNPSSVRFPYFNLPQVVGGSTLGSGSVISSQVRKSSLLDNLGISAGTTEIVSSSQPLFGQLNATPIIGYYDIFRNYYANTQEQDFYICGSSLPSPGQVVNPVWYSESLSGIDDFIMKFVQGERSFVTAWNNSSIGTNPITTSCSNPLGGLCLSTLRPDLFTAWLSKANYDTMVQSSVINVEDNIVTVNQIRLQSRILEYYERGLVSGGRYDDWVESEFGIKTNKKLCIPEYLGSAYSDILFDEVVSSVVGETAGGVTPQGTLTGRGVGSLDSRTFHFTASENGYLMAIYTITPNVMHSSGILPLFFKNDYQSLYSPVFSGLGFQPLPYKYFVSLPTIAGEGSADSPVNRAFVPNMSLGYQPAWSEYTTAIDRVSGELGVTGSLNYWVLTRTPWNRDSLISGSLANRSFFGIDGSDPISVVPTSYILPNQYTLPFADQGPTAENFIVSLGFDVRARRAMPKHVMPSLS